MTTWRLVEYLSLTSTERKLEWLDMKYFQRREGAWPSPWRLWSWWLRSRPWLNPLQTYSPRKPAITGRKSFQTIAFLTFQLLGRASMELVLSMSGKQSFLQPVNRWRPCLWNSTFCNQSVKPHLGEVQDDFGLWSCHEHWLPWQVQQLGQGVIVNMIGKQWTTYF